jgi:hypothetical protein
LFNLFEGVRSIWILCKRGHTAVDLALGDRPVFLGLCPVVGPPLVVRCSKNFGCIACTDKVPITFSFSDELETPFLKDVIKIAIYGFHTCA